MSSARLALYAACSSVVATIGQPAGAAQTAPDAPEIVVTAQRRPEHAQDVPISLTALSGGALDRLQATDMASLGRVVPSLNMTRTGAFTQPYLRGVGKRSTLGVENSVATYVDGVYYGSALGSLLDLRGIARIEVLNGPQGTLFGRNTTGGVIQIITREPTAETEAEVTVQAGSYGYLRGDAYLSGGSGAVAGNLAMSLSRNGGYGTNLYSGDTDQGETDHSLVARGRWRWQASPSLTIGMAADYQDVDNDFAYRPVAGFPPIGQPGIQDFRDGDQDTPSRYRFRFGGASVRADAQIGGLTFMSLTALRAMHAQYGTDLDQGPQLLWAGIPTAEQEQFSQEFQLQSAASSPVQWVVGLYYINIEVRYDPTHFFYGGSYSALLGGRIRQTLFDTGIASSYAAYGQGSLPLGAATALTLGLRYTSERRSVEANGEREFDTAPFIRPTPGLPLLTEPPLRNSDTFGELTWRLALDHHFSDRVMGYLSVNRGFQSGGWSLQTPQNPPFGPETLDDFEAGLKYVSASRNLSADANVFYYDYSDLQVSAITPIGSVTTNAASAELYGLELQLSARPASGTELTAGLQWLHARFNSFPNATCTDFSAGAAVPYSPISCDASGNDLPYAPELKFNLGANQQFSLGGNGTLLASGNLSYNSGYFSEADNVARQDAYATLDLSLEWRPRTTGPSLRLWVLNLTDTHYYDSLATQPTAGVIQRPAAPRRFGATLGYSL
ncbi:MAG TPA: TonB-dependent receptor [Allosphingosinicella sp.]|nr:TonB-dependent receptor [Allosphingosinicella sp.]